MKSGRLRAGCLLRLLPCLLTIFAKCCRMPFARSPAERDRFFSSSSACASSAFASSAFARFAFASFVFCELGFYEVGFGELDFFASLTFLRAWLFCELGFCDPSPPASCFSIALLFRGGIGSKMKRRRVSWALVYPLG